MFGTVLGLRLVLALSTHGYLGVDGGAYHLSALSVLGLEHTGSDFMRPPLAPGWLLAAFLLLPLDSTTAYNLYAAIFSMPIVFVGWLIARNLLGVTGGRIVLVLLGFDWALTGLFVTGVVPLVGFAFLLLASWGLWRLSAVHVPRYRLAAVDSQRLHTYIGVVVLGMCLVAFTNQTSAGLAAIVLPLQWAILPHKRRTFLALALGGLLALAALPWYFDASPMSGKLTYPGLLIAPHAPWEHQLWAGLLFLWLLRDCRRHVYERGEPFPPWFTACGSVITFLAFFQMFQSHNEVLQNLFFRSTYLVMPFFWLVATYAYLPDIKRWLQVKRLAVAMTCLLLVGVSVQQFTAQRRLSDFGDAVVVDLARQIPEGSGRVLTNAYSLGLYVAAESQRPVLWTTDLAPPPAYEQDNRDARCTLGWEDGCGPAPDVDYVLIDTFWPHTAFWSPPRSQYGSPEQRPWHLLDDVPWLRLVAQDGRAKLYEVRT